jgi:hypothetical protein
MSDNEAQKNPVSAAEAQELANRFIELANTLKNEGHKLEAVNAGLMYASCIYATYSTAGNEGFLHESGVDKVAGVYKRNLAQLQKAKKALADKPDT